MYSLLAYFNKKNQNLKSLRMTVCNILYCSIAPLNLTDLTKFMILYSFLVFIHHSLQQQACLMQIHHTIIRNP